MIAFTILGVLVFWCCCFSLGYALIPTTQALWAFLLVELTHHCYMTALHAQMAALSAAKPEGAK